MDDLYFEVPAGSKGGLVSHSRDKTYDDRNPHIMLLAGYRPGLYLLHAIERRTGNIVGESKFIVEGVWSDENTGPLFWLTGPVSHTGHVPTYAMGSAWGGGPTGPQNINVIPARGVRRIAIVLIDFVNQRYPTITIDLQAIRDRWMNEAINGVAVGTATRSVRQYYREVSFGTFDIVQISMACLPSAWLDLELFSIQLGPR